jgi:integrase
MGEMFALCADDVDTSNRTIRIRRQVQSIRGKGQIVDLPKGRKRRTTIYPVRTPPTKRYPKGYPLADEMRKRKAHASKGQGEHLMFPAPEGGFYNSSNFYERRLHPAAIFAKWPTKKVMRRNKDGVVEETDGLVWTWHDLRHVFCAYYLWDRGAKPVDVSQAAGHANVMTTLRIYSSDAPGAVDRLTSLG